VVYFRPPFIAMPNVASVGRSFPSLSDSGKPPVGFLRKWFELSLVYFFDVIFYPPSHPPTREGNWSHCSGYLSWLDGRGELLLWLSLDLSSWVGKLGGGSSGYSWVMVQKFFNRSPITLKFGGRKLERESQERESESESERSKLLFYACKLSFYTRKLAFYTRKLSFYTRKLSFYTCKLSFYTCKLEEVWNSNILIYFFRDMYAIYFFYL
jgi:hypothetical protein